MENETDIFTQNAFYKDILAAWCHCIKHQAISSYRHEILWNNGNIKLEGKTIMYSQWYSCGIKYLEDIYDNAAKSFYTFGRLREKYAIPEGDFF